MAQRKRRTIDERIAAIQVKLKELEAKKEKQSSKKQAQITLTKESKGMPELIQQLDLVIKENKIKAAEVVMLLARLKRTGLKLSKSKQA